MSRWSSPPEARALLVLSLAFFAAARPLTVRGQEAVSEGGASHYLRAAYQAGPVLQTNGFLRGDNLSGEPIESFQSIRLEFGWQTDGSKDWHHEYNFPTFGIGLFGEDLNNEEELGTPTSLYGFLTWPIKRTQRWKYNFELAFGFTNDWKPYDPVDNPKNVALGLGRSVHIELGVNAEFRVSDRWSAIAGITGTHFSNGGTQRPNNGLNQVGPIVFLKYDVDQPVAVPETRREGSFVKSWDLVFTSSVGKRNLDLKIEDDDVRAEYGNQSYPIVNLTAIGGWRFAYKSRLVGGLDFGYDASVEDLARVEAFNTGGNPDYESIDDYELAIVGGYEIFAHRTHLLLHLAYKIWSADTPGRLPKFYQRLGVRQFVYRNFFAGLNVRFHELGDADNLEWNAGYKVSL